MGTLHCEQVTVRLGGVAALDDVSIAVSPGECVGLVGPNGAGKTTLLNVLTGFIRTVHGRVLLDDQDISKWSVRQRARAGLSRTFQGQHLFSTLSIAENLELAALASGRSRRESIADAAELMDSLGVGKLRERRCTEIPHGDAQRVSLARALVVRPRYVVLDEPAAGLSDGETGGFVDAIRRVAADGVGVLLVEHDLNFVERVCGRLNALAEGRLIFSGSMQEAFASPVVQEAYLGVTGDLTDAAAGVDRCQLS